MLSHILLTYNHMPRYITSSERYMTAYQGIPLGGLADQLKAARLQKKLSQRALSERVGIPQSHLSKIENGQVNIQVASLTQIARALDLELLLVPKKVVPAVEALTRSAALVPQGATISTHEPIQIQEARRALEVAQRKAYSLIRSLDSPPEAERLGEMVAYLAQAPLTFELRRLDPDYSWCGKELESWRCSVLAFGAGAILCGSARREQRCHDHERGRATPAKVHVALHWSLLHQTQVVSSQFAP